MYSKDFIKLLQQKPSPNFIISTHKFCDGDGLGAGLALLYALKKINQKVSFFTLEPIHSKYEFLNKNNVIQVFNEKNTQIPKKSIFIFVDVNDTRLMEPLYSLAHKNKGTIYFIDHHPIIQKNSTDHFFINSSCSSTAELIYSLLKELKTDLDEDICLNLFSSIVFDTNRFRDIKNSSKPFSIASEIIPQIKDVNLIYENLFKNLTVDKIRFMSQLENVEYYSNNRIAFLHLKESVFKKYNTDNTQAYDLMEMIRDVKTIDSTALLIENEKGDFKLSLRSKNKNLIPLAKSFNGGGHAHSAGAYIKSKSLQEIKEAVISYLKK
ncbi:MAG: DHH family phosphoesterase [Bdellovibrionaceae bacterium]|nr:DHH family phosphoesterase [Pseudobdellovibrionaceae bacterium]